MTSCAAYSCTQSSIHSPYPFGYSVQDIFYVIPEVKTIQLAALEQRVHKRDVARAFITSTMKPITSAHGGMAKHSRRALLASKATLAMSPRMNFIRVVFPISL